MVHDSMSALVFFFCLRINMGATGNRKESRNNDNGPVSHALPQQKAGLRRHRHDDDLAGCKLHDGHWELLLLAWTARWAAFQGFRIAGATAVQWSSPGWQLQNSVQCHSMSAEY